MSEEIVDAATTVPRAMVWSLVLNGAVALAMSIAILFAAGDTSAALDSDFAYPFIGIVLRTFKSRAATAVMLAVVLIIDMGLLVGMIAASSRMLWAFARDRGVPYWGHISKVRVRNGGVDEIVT